MGLLAPLYALAALAIAGPIIFHLIRRQPQGRLQFSSLMFLSPSPPRLTRRSRLDNLYLLLLRILAILLIAFAFARPYVREESFLNSTLSGRRIVAVVDTSGSMQRPDVWEIAKRELAELVDSLSVDDHLALYTLDESLNAVVAIDDEGIVDAATSQQAVRAAIDQLKPTWQRTRLADGLMALADLVSAAAISGKIDPTAGNEIVLITDLHGESGLEPLQGYPWPETISLDVRQVLPSLPGNARASLMQAADDEDQAEATPIYRVRVENNADSTEQTFQLTWAGASGAIAGSGTTLQVPAGQVRVVPLGSRPTGADRLDLLGDAWAGDNSVFVVEPISTLERIAFVGTTQSQPEDDLSYFLEQAPLSTELYRREIIRLEPAGLPAVLAETETKVVVVEPTAGWESHAASLRSFAESGGTVVVCLARESSDRASNARFLEEIFAVSGLEISEAGNDDFALLSSIDFQHPVFAPFADPRFNDFGKMRFWSHRVVSLPETTELRVVAAFDDDSPMLIEQAVGRGRIWLLTSGWQPTASGLGLSSKFVPILMGLLDPSGRSRQTWFTYEVGDKIDVEPFGDLKVTDSQGNEVDVSVLERQKTSVSLRVPGLFWLRGENMSRQIANQLPASESRLDPMDVAIFEQYGVVLGRVASDTERRESVRQLQIEELERKQRLWQWLIAAGIVVLSVETFSAGWLARKAALGMA